MRIVKAGQMMVSICHVVQSYKLPVSLLSAIKRGQISKAARPRLSNKTPTHRKMGFDFYERAAVHPSTQFDRCVL
jgi:hypothetical protein